jgi:HSP20 family protein
LTAGSDAARTGTAAAGKRNDRGVDMDVKSLIPFSRRSALSGAEGDPFASMRREMERVFDSFSRDWNLPEVFAPSGFQSPKVDLAETGAGLELTAELPGIDPKDIQLDLSEGVLTLRAEHKTQKEEKDEKKQYHLIERARGSYLRRFALPFDVDEDKVEAHFDKGILKVSVPRSAQPEKAARKIEIKAG